MRGDVTGDEGVVVRAQPRDSRGIGHVGRHRDDASASAGQLSGQPVERLFVTGGQRHRGARSREGAGNGCAIPRLAPVTMATFPSRWWFSIR